MERKGAGRVNVKPVERNGSGLVRVDRGERERATPQKAVIGWKMENPGRRCAGAHQFEGAMGQSSAVLAWARPNSLRIKGLILVISSRH
jgi:hypothetical protein